VTAAGSPTNQTNPHSVAAAWKALQERNVVTEETEEGYAAKLGDSVSF